MDVRLFSSPAEFAPLVQPLIEREPAEYSILATLLDSALHGRPLPGACWLLLSDPEGVPVGAGLHNEPYSLVLTRFFLPPSSLGAAAAALVHAVRVDGRMPNGVTGSSAECSAFAAQWTAVTGLPTALIMSEQLYSIATSPAPSSVPGAPRSAGEGDLDLLVRWFAAFDAEAHVDTIGEPGLARARRRLAHGALLLWEVDGVPVSMAGLNGPVTGVSRVGPVYTPPEHRRHGYGSAVTVAATRLGFSRGPGPVVLYADLANPTSNSVYRAIGYRPAGDAVMISFRTG